MEKSSSEDSSIHRSPSLDSKDSDFAKPSTSGRPFGRGFTAGAFYGTAGSRGQSRAEAGVKTDKYNAPKGSKYVVFYLDLSFVFLLEFKKCNMARGCLCCLKYMMFLFNLIFWVSPSVSLSLCPVLLLAYHSVNTLSLLGAALLCSLHGGKCAFKKIAPAPLSCTFVFPFSLSLVAEWELQLACLQERLALFLRGWQSLAPPPSPVRKPRLEVPLTGQPAVMAVGSEFLTAVSLSWR